MRKAEVSGLSGILSLSRDLIDPELALEINGLLVGSIATATLKRDGTLRCQEAAALKRGTIYGITDFLIDEMGRPTGLRRARIWLPPRGLPKGHA